MLYNKHNLDVAKIAAKTGYRPELAGVLFTKDKTVATDSFRLLEVSVRSDVNVADFPQIQGVSAMRGCDPFIVNAKVLREIKIPKASTPIIENVAIKHLTAGGVEFFTTDLQGVDVKSAPRIEGKFPDYEQIIPKGAPVAEMIVNGKLLGELLEIMAKLSPREEVKIKFYGSYKPLVLEAGNDTQKSRGLMMGI